MLQDELRIGLLKKPIVRDIVAQEKAAVTGKIDIDDVYSRVDPADVVFAGKLTADAPIAAFVMDRRNQNPFVPAPGRRKDGKGATGGSGCGLRN